MAAILVVDPDIKALAAMGRLFKNLGATVYLSTNAEYATRVLHRDLPRVILCELDLPGISGFEFLRQAKESHPATYGILHTAATDLPRAFGADIPVLAKPCPEHELQMLVAILIRED